jgi:hypothetical protein
MFGGEQVPTHHKILDYTFLEEMYMDDYFPNFLVDKGKGILLALCRRIEDESPTLPRLYELSHAATEEFNQLAIEFENNESEIETAARDCIGMDFYFISQAYGYDADVEELISPRDW